MNILVMTNKDPDFYRLIGPFLARRDIAKEIGAGSILDGVIWDDDGKQWFVALQNGKVVGFATMLIKGNSRVLFCEAYILPGYREQGMYLQLIDERLAHCPAGSTVQIVIHSDSVPLYEARGFVVRRERGAQFTEMTKIIEEAQ